MNSLIDIPLARRIAEMIDANGQPFETSELITIVRVLGRADSSDFGLGHSSA
jgi:hypothetical protein